MKNQKQLIDRAEVYRRACAGCTRHGEAPMECYHDEHCERLIFEFTTAEPVNAVEVVNGYWIEDYQPLAYGFNKIQHKCSVCGGIRRQKSNYCSDCGAKMLPEPPKGE